MLLSLLLPLPRGYIVADELELLPATWCSRTKGARRRRRTEVDRQEAEDHRGKERKGTWNSRWVLPARSDPRGRVIGKRARARVPASARRNFEVK